MGSKINIRTGNECADKEPSLSRIFSVGRNYKHLKASKAIQSNLTELDATCNEIEEGNVVRNGRPNVADEFLIGFNHPETMDRRNKYRNVFNINGFRHGAACKMDNYKSAAIGAIHAIGQAKTSANKITQTSKSVEICQNAAHCSKSMHQHYRARSKSNFAKPNKCICKELCEQSSRKHRPVNLSTVNAKKVYASNQMLAESNATSNYYRKSRCRCIIPGPSRNRSKRDVVKCCDCERYILHKYHIGNTNGVRHCSTRYHHLHSSNRNHSNSPCHIQCCKHH